MAITKENLQQMKANVVEFCTLTTAHGFAYVVNCRNKGELAFWAIVLLIPLFWAVILAMEIYVELTDEPVVKVIKSLSYDPSKVAAPSIAFCPDQYLDELHLLSIRLNEIQFRCREDEAVQHADMELCDAAYMKDIRGHEAFSAFLAALREMVQFAADEIDAEIDWKRQMNNVYPMKGKRLEAIEGSYRYGLALDKVYPKSPDMVIDAEHITLKYLPLLLHEVAEAHPAILKSAGVVDFFRIETSEQDLSSAIGSDNDSFFTSLLLFYGQVQAGVNVTKEDLRNTLQKIAADFLRIGEQRVMNYDMVAQPNDFAGHGILHDYELWRDILKEYYFMSKLSNVGLGSLVRQYLPSLVLQDVLHPSLVPLGNQVNASVLNDTILSKLYDLGHAFLPFGSIQWSFHLEEKNTATSYFKDMIPSGNETFPFTPDVTVALLGAMQFAMLANPPPEGLTRTEAPEQLQLYDPSNLELETPDLKTYKTVHFLDTIPGDTIAQFLAFESLTSPMQIIEETPLEYRPYQVGQQLANLNMVPFCSKDANCEENMKQLATVHGLCSVWNGQLLEEDLSRNDMTPFLQEVFHFPKREKSELMFSSIKSMTFLFDTHNTEIKKSLNDLGSISMAVGEGSTLPYVTVQEDVYSYTPEVRGCYLPHESTTESNISSTYSKSGCVYECAINAAINDQSEACIPWNIPYTFQLEETRICSGAEAARFKSRMHKSNALCESQCMEACSSTGYLFSAESRLTNPALACRNADFFEALQNEEHESEFTFRHSVRRKYPLGSPIKESFCHAKMENDVIVLVVHFRSSSIVQSSVEWAYNVMDLVGLFGGMLGLFVGCSLMLVTEICDLVVANISRALNMVNCQTDFQAKQPLLKILLLYFESTTLHGLQYISIRRNLLAKLAWGLIVVLSSAASIEFSRLAHLGFVEQPLLKVLEHDALDITRTAYPTLTICPQQYNDRWNLAQALLNARPLRDPLSQEINADVYETFEAFLRPLISHAWVSEEELAKQPVVNTSMAYELLEALMFTSENRALYEYRTLEILNGRIEPWQPVKLELELDAGGDEAWYELDLGRAVPWYGVILEKTNAPLEIVSLAGSNRSLAKGEEGAIAAHNIQNKYMTHVARKCYQDATGPVPVVSRYVYVKIAGNMTTVEQVLLTGDTGKEPKVLLVASFARLTSYIFVAIGSASLITALTDRISEEYPSLEDCAPTAFAKFNHCQDDLKILWQLHLWEELSLSKMGTMIARFAETVIGGTFHPDSQHSNENRMILSPVEQEIYLYSLLAQLSDGIFQTSTDLALIEIPVLLEQQSHASKLVTPTQREQAANKIFYAHYKQWKSGHVPGNETYILKLEENRYYDAAIHGHLIWAKVWNQMHNFDFLDVHRWFDTSQTAAADVEEHRIFNLSSSLGLDSIQGSYESSHFSKLFGANLKGVMAVMRFSQVLGNMYMEPSRLQETFADRWPIGSQESLSDYSHVQLKSGVIRTISQSLEENVTAEGVAPSFLIDPSWNRLEMVAECAFGSIYPDTLSCQSAFHHILADQGICSSFNSLSLHSQYREHASLDTFMSLYNTAARSSADLAPGYGSLNRLSLVLDIHQTDVFGSQSGHFEIAVNSAPDAFSTLESFVAQAGQKTDVSITTIVTRAEDNVQADVGVEARSCRFRDEVVDGAGAFAHYSEKRCRYECQLGKAKRSVPCVPWNHLRTEDEHASPVCTRDEVGHFQGNLSSAREECEQGCLANCEDVLYEYSTDHMKLDPVIACSKVDILLLAQLGISEKHEQFYWKYWRRSQWQFDSVGHNLPIDELSRCMDKVEKDYAFVNFVLPKSHAGVLTMSKKYEFVSKLSIIGGTLGLWIGFSLLSAVEFSYWLFMAITYKLYETRGWQAMP